MRDMAKRIRPSTPFPNKASSSSLLPPLRPLCDNFSTSRPRPQASSTPTETPSPTTPALFSSTVMTLWTVSAPPSTKSKMTTPFAPLYSTATLLSNRNVTGPRSIWNRAASSGASTVFAVTCGVPISESFRTTRRLKAPTRSENTTREYSGG